MSISKCCFLTCIQISQKAGQVVWYSYLLKNFPQFSVIPTVRDFSVINKEVDVFLKFSCIFYDPTDVGNLTSASFDFIESSLNIWKFMVHVLLKPSLEIFEYYFASVWDECNCVVAWTFFDIAFLWNLNENRPFLVPTAEFSKFDDILSAALLQHHLSGFEIDQLKFHHLH